ncbi:hypothetical protein [uncultured Roseibium sp.]|uniref:hypothetical protein n=1 Tax=uncultured Roseibium sp. TaxID=1936171 RepID=UPI00260D1992|nr:hypothetical protein [uncultured Roseibium sp.]
MNKVLYFLPFVALSGCVTDDSPTSPRPSKDELICIDSGFTPGTLEFSQCLATAKIARQTAEDVEKERQKEREKRDTVSASVANQICVDYAKERMPYPVIRNQTVHNISGGYRQTVRVSFELDQPGTSYSSRSAECKIQGREVVNFKIT